MATCLENISQKDRWMGQRGPATAQQKLMSSNGKGHRSISESSDDDFDQYLMERATPRTKALSQKPWSVKKERNSSIVVSSDVEDDATFETCEWMGQRGPATAQQKLMSSNGKGHRSTSESSDDDFDQYLMERATPRTKALSQKPWSVKKELNFPIVVSSGDEDDATFETFLERMKTPITKPKKTSENGSEDRIQNFIVDDVFSDDDFVKPKSSSKVPKAKNTSAGRQTLKTPLLEFNSPVFISDEDDEDNIVVKSTWKTRHTKPKPLLNVDKEKSSDSGKENRPPSSPLLPVPSLFPRRTEIFTDEPRRLFSAPAKVDDSDSSEEEFISLLDRLKKKNVIAGSRDSPKNNTGDNEKPVVSGPPRRAEGDDWKPPLEKHLTVKKPGKSSILKPNMSLTEPRPAPTSRIPKCKTPGCFLQSLSDPNSSYVDGFKRNKEDLTSKLFKLYNTSVFDNKLPADMSVTWNKKMRKTAGYCITGQTKVERTRYARIELSEKVCDSADRLRDTLIHEMCHAATWLINSVRDGHGNFWKLYARKSTLVHPELPMVTRCHSYEIKYKFQYQCTRCNNTIGRHSKSLDTQRFACALCTGEFVLLKSSKSRAPTPFANFVKENYGNVRQELVGQSHAEVMRKLSADFASKTKLSAS